jgi:hypothetical protein
VRAEIEHVLGGRVASAARVSGGNSPSATFRLRLRDGRRAFFKGTYPLPADSGVRWVLDREERVYRDLGGFVWPWAPMFLGVVQRDGWHALLLEDLGPPNVLPCTPTKARIAARSYAEFHRSTLDRPVPDWVPSGLAWRRFSQFFQRITQEGGLDGPASIARSKRDEARSWLEAHFERLRATSEGLARAPRPYALLHFDTRSDNVRLHGPQLRIFDWPWACLGPAEFDLAEFAQSVSVEGGPSPEFVLAAYEEVLPLRPAVLDAAVAALAGYFLLNAWRPSPPGRSALGLRRRRQLVVTLAWVARRLALPEPDWLAAVAA